MSLNEQNPALSRMIIAEQTSIGVKKTTDTDFVRAIYETPSNGIMVRQNRIVPERITTYRSQVKQAKGRYILTPDVTILGHVVGLGILLKHLMTGTVSTVQTATQELAAAQNLDGNLEITTQPTATVPSVNPCKITVNGTGVTLSAGTMTVTGTNERDDALVEAVAYGPFTAETMAITTTKYFKTVTTLTMTTTSGNLASVNGDPGTWEHTFKLGNAPLNGLTIEVDKGVIPNHYWDGVLNTGTITIPAEDVISCVFGTMFTNYKIGEAVDGGTTPLDISGWTETGRLPAELFSEGAGALSVNSITMDAQDLELTIDNRWIQHPGITTGRNPAFPNGINTAEVGLTINVPFLDPTATSTPDIDALVDEQTQIPIDYTHSFLYESGPEYFLNINAPLAEIADFTDPVLGVGNRIIREMICRPLPSVGHTDNDEITVKLTNGSQNLNLTGWSTI